MKKLVWILRIGVVGAVAFGVYRQVQARRPKPEKTPVPVKPTIPTKLTLADQPAS